MEKNDSPFMLSTVDNIYSPFSDFQRWYLEDLRLGYDTAGLLARIAANADEFNDFGNDAAMRDIVTNNYSGKHVMVTKDDFDTDGIRI